MNAIKTIKILIFIASSFICIKAHCQKSQSDKEINLKSIEKYQKVISKTTHQIDSISRIRLNGTYDANQANPVNNKVGFIQKTITSDSSLTDTKKIAFLRGLSESLNAFAYALRSGEMIPGQYLPLADAYEKAMNFDQKNLSILPIIQENDYKIGAILTRSFPFQNNKDIDSSKELVVLKAWKKNPAKILDILYDNPDVPAADSIIRITARNHPEALYIFAQAKNSSLGLKIAKSDDLLVKLIDSVAGMNEGRLYFPFLGNLIQRKISLKDIRDAFTSSDRDSYFKLLVKTQIDYTTSMQTSDTIIAMQALMDMLKRKALSDYISIVNDLHEKPDPVRLKVLKSLNPEDLYYLLITGEDELYTSSYLKIYGRIFQGLKIGNSYAFLKSVHFDHFRRFIKMASNFNTLRDFLQRMRKENADSIMRSFVNVTEGNNRVEEAVDVADSYASLPGNRLRNLIQEEVQKNLAASIKSGNKSAHTIYGLLDTILLSMDSSKKIDISSSLGIPPVYGLTNKSLMDRNQRIIIQQFFYGDDDGKKEFNSFLKAYNNANWKITLKEDWVEVQSTKGKDVVVYSNKPLDDDTYMDAMAQQSLGKYLEENNLHPSVVIHRGHSYYAGLTIAQLAPTAKLILLGSCGGYNNLSQVIKTCPYIQIIATKQVGSGSINQPIIIYLTDLLRRGQDLNWPIIWKSLSRKFQHDERFEDYIPPHENLGAIFIMAYNKAMMTGN